MHTTTQTITTTLENATYTFPLFNTKFAFEFYLLFCTPRPKKITSKQQTNTKQPLQILFHLLY